MTQNLDIALGVDEWGAIPAYVVGLFGMVGAQASFGGYGLSTVLVSNVLGHSWDVATVLALGGVAVAAVVYGWVDMIQTGDYATEELVSLAIAAAIPLGLVIMPSTLAPLTSNALYGLVSVAVGAAGLYYGTLAIELEGDVPILSSIMGA